MSICTQLFILLFLGWTGASLRIVQHRLLINWQIYLSKCFFMKECRGDQTIKISEQQQSEREIQHPTKSLLAGVYYTSHRCIFSQVYITHPLKKKKGLREAWIIDQLTTHLFSSKGHNSGHSSCVLFFCKYIVSMYFKKPSPTLYHNKSLVWSEQQQHCTHTI